MVNYLVKELSLGRSRNYVYGLGMYSSLQWFGKDTADKASFSALQHLQYVEMCLSIRASICVVGLIFPSSGA